LNPTEAFEKAISGKAHKNSIVFLRRSNKSNGKNYHQPKCVQNNTKFIPGSGNL
jgi:hypothetical protein